MNSTTQLAVDHKLPVSSRRNFLLLAGMSGLALTMPTLLTGCGSGTEPEIPYAAALREARKAAHEVIGQGGASAMGVALVTATRTVWTETFGFADVAASQPANDSTMFGVASVSKVFATVAAMKLVDRGLLDLDVPVAHYLPAFRMADSRYADITARMLLNHSSGIAGTIYRDYLTKAPYPSYDKEFLATLASQQLKAAPGYMSVYCNDGFTLFEFIVEAVTGMSFAQFMQSGVFDPLDMKNSQYPLLPLAEGSFARIFTDGVSQPQEFSSSLGAGGLYTTPSDLAKFARMFLNGGAVGSTRILSPSALERMAVDQTLATFNPAPSPAEAFGLGWDTVTEPGLQHVGVRAWTKNGGSVHYGAQLLVAPDAGLGVLVMGTNGGGYNPLAIAQRVLLRALTECAGISYFPAPLNADWAPPAELAPSPSAEYLASVAGVYADYERVSQLRAEPDGSLTWLEYDFGSGTYSPIMPDLRLRTDGWFTSDAFPLLSLQCVQGDGRTYSVVRLPNGAMHYLVSATSAQRLDPPHSPLLPAWNARIARTWLLVNESHDSLLIPAAADPRFKLATTDDLEGYLVAMPPGLAPNVVDPSSGASVARMLLVIPGNAGRDLNQLEVVERQGEEWLQWGGWVYRPTESVQQLPRASITAVTIGADGLAEWRAFTAAAQPISTTIDGAESWRIYDAAFGLVASGTGAGQVAIPAGAGIYHLEAFGPPGSVALATLT